MAHVVVMPGSDDEPIRVREVNWTLPIFRLHNNLMRMYNRGVKARKATA